MPRTFKATIVLVLTLILLSLLTILNVWQTNNAESDIVSLQQRVQKLQETTNQLLEKVQGGVAVSGNQRQSASGDTNKYKAALDDPDNLLEPPTEQLIPSDAKDGGTLRRVMTADPKGFNWLTENAAGVSEIQEYVHSTYGDRDLEKPDKWVPELAYKVTVNDDYTEYTIHIRENVYWQRPNVDFSKEKYAWLDEPHKLNAEDCKFYFDMVKNPQVQAGAAKAYYEDVEEVKIIDDNTFKVIWKEKTFQSLPATMEAYPLPKHIFTRTESGKKIAKESLGLKFNSHWASRHPVGVGAYNFIKYRQGTRIVLTHNDKYYGKLPPIERIEYNIIKDPNRRYLKLKADEIDFSPLAPPVYKQNVLEGGPNSPFETGKLEYDKIDRFAYSYIGWNMDKPLFEEAKVRRALTHAFNRKGIIENVYNSLGHVQDGPFFYKHPANSPNVEPYKHDLDKAASLLEAAGWTDYDGDGIREKTIDGSEREFEFTITAYNQPTWKSVLSVYKEDLRKIGINMSYSPVDWPTMQKKMNEKNFDAYTGGWALAWAIDPFQIWHSSQADIPKGSNRVGFRNEKADKLIEQMRASFDRDKRLEMARDFHELLHKKQPYTFFRAPQQVYAWQPRLQNVVFQKIRPQALSIPWYIKPGERLD